VINLYKDRYSKNNTADNKAIMTIDGGIGEQRTWVCKELALEFAMWISPEFEVWCIDALDELFQTG